MMYCNAIYSLLLVSPIILLPLYHLILYPLFHTRIPSILKRVGIGLILLLLSFISTSSMDLAQHINDPNITCYYVDNSTVLAKSDLNLLPFGMYYLGYTICLLSLFEFVVAQTPCHMRGLTIALFYTFRMIYAFLDWGILMTMSAHFPAHFFPGCKFYYYVIYILIVCGGFGLFVPVAKWYRLRVRNVPVPYHMFAENYYDKYIQIRDNIAAGSRY